MKQALLIVISLLICASLVLLSFLAFYYADQTLSYKELEFSDFYLENGVLTFRVKATLKGMYVYSVQTVQNGEDLLLTLRGGKQPSRAQTPSEQTASFAITVPEDVKDICCGSNTVFNAR